MRNNPFMIAAFGLLIVAAICCISVGCQSRPVAVPEAIYNDSSTTPVQDVLPKNAKNFVDLGNGWLTFELEVNGRTRTFMFARFRSHNCFRIGTITELRD